MFLGKRLIKEVPTSSLPRNVWKFMARKLYRIRSFWQSYCVPVNTYSVMSIAGNLLKTFGGLASLRQATLHELEEIRG